MIESDKINFRNKLLVALRNVTPRGITAIGKDDYIQFYRGSEFVSNVFVESQYEDFQSGKSLEYIASQIIEPIRDNDFSGGFTLEEVKDLIYPVIKPTLLSGKIDLDKGSQLIYTDDLIEGLYIEYVIDINNAMAYITNDILRMLGINTTELHNLAIKNIRRKSQPSFFEFKKEKKPFLFSATNDGYDASRILSMDINSLKTIFKNNALIGVPNRDFLIIFEEGTPFEHFARNQIMRDYKEKAYAISPNVYQWNDHKFVIK